MLHRLHTFSVMLSAADCSTNGIRRFLSEFSAASMPRLLSFGLCRDSGLGPAGWEQDMGRGILALGGDCVGAVEVGAGGGDGFCEVFEPVCSWN